MSMRERWIIYPLLFLSLGVVLGDKIILPGHGGNPGLQFEAGEIAAVRFSQRIANLWSERQTGRSRRSRSQHALRPHRDKDLQGRAPGSTSLERRWRLCVRDRHAGRIGLMGHTPQDFGLYAKTPLTGWAIPIIAWPGQYKTEKKTNPAPAKAAPSPPQKKKTPENSANTPTKEE